MSRRRSNNSWQTVLRDSTRVPSDPRIRELVKLLARRSAEAQHEVEKETLLTRQRRKKLKEIKNKK